MISRRLVALAAVLGALHLYGWAFAAFSLATFRFDGAQNRVVPAADFSSNGQPRTGVLVLREGQVYFEGGHREMLESPDPYLKKFLIPQREVH